MRCCVKVRIDLRGCIGIKKSKMLYNFTIDKSVKRMYCNDTSKKGAIMTPKIQGMNR